MELTGSRSGVGRYQLPDLVTLEPGDNRVTSLSEKAYHLIRDRLITLRIRPGETLDERALQEELDVGRTPVREALRKLADEQLVHVVPRRGIFACPIDLGALSAISEVRVELESYAGHLAAIRSTHDDHRAIKEVLDELDARRTDTTHLDLIRLDLRIHRTVHRATHNAYLVATLDEYYVHSMRMWFLVLDRLDHLGHALDSHRDLLTAVSGGDPETARRLLREHVNEFELQIRAVL